MNSISFPVHDIVVHDLGVSGTLEFNVRTTFGTPKYLLFYTKFDSVGQTREYVNMARSLKKIELRVNSSSKVVFDGNVDHVTSTNFPEYMPVAHWGRGNMLVVEWDSLPSGVVGRYGGGQQQCVAATWTLEVADGYDHAYFAGLPCRLMCAAIYKDKFINIDNNVQRLGWSG